MAPRQTRGVVRHGETEWARAGGQAHRVAPTCPLTEHGREQAAAGPGASSRGVDFSLVLCSPLRRARETCRLAGFGEAAEIDDDLCEWDYGEYEGLTTPEIRETTPDGGCGATAARAARRPRRSAPASTGCSRGAPRSTGEVLAFAHGHVLRVLTARWLGMEVAAGAHFKLATAGVGVLGHERETTRAVALVDLSRGPRRPRGRAVMARAPKTPPAPAAVPVSEIRRPSQNS